MKVGVPEDSVLSLLLFIIVFEALPHEFSSGVPWEDLYTNDLVIIAESLEECVRRLLIWKEAMEEKKLLCRKKKIMICGMNVGFCRVQTIFMCCLSHWSGQEQNLLQWLQAQGAQEMQWGEVLGKGP